MRLLLLLWALETVEMRLYILNKTYAQKMVSQYTNLKFGACKKVSAFGINCHCAVSTDLNYLCYPRLKILLNTFAFIILFIVCHFNGVRKVWFIHIMNEIIILNLVTIFVLVHCKKFKGFIDDIPTAYFVMFSGFVCPQEISKYPISWGVQYLTKNNKRGASKNESYLCDFSRWHSNIFKCASVK